MRRSYFKQEKSYVVHEDREWSGNNNTQQHKILHKPSFHLESLVYPNDKMMFNGNRRIHHHDDETRDHHDDHGSHRGLCGSTQQVTKKKNNEGTTILRPPIGLVCPPPVTRWVPPIVTQYRNSIMEGRREVLESCHNPKWGYGGFITEPSKSSSITKNNGYHHKEDFRTFDGKGEVEDSDHDVIDDDAVGFNDSHRIHHHDDHGNHRGWWGSTQQVTKGKNNEGTTILRPPLGFVCPPPVTQWVPPPITQHYNDNFEGRREVLESHHKPKWGHGGFITKPSKSSSITKNNGHQHMEDFRTFDGKGEVKDSDHEVIDDVEDLKSLIKKVENRYGEGRVKKIEVIQYERNRMYGDRFVTTYSYPKESPWVKGF